MLHGSADIFSRDELEAAARLRQSQPNQRRGESAIFDRCPHTPACQSVALCIEEIAWYVRHRHELDTVHES